MRPEFASPKTEIKNITTVEQSHEKVSPKIELMVQHAISTINATFEVTEATRRINAIFDYIEGVLYAIHEYKVRANTALQSSPELRDEILKNLSDTIQRQLTTVPEYITQQTS
jgi:hypothetical protein